MKQNKCHLLLIIQRKLGPAVNRSIADRWGSIRYKKLRKQWVRLATSQDIHSIWKQISELLWQDSIYRTFNEACRLNDESGEGAPKTVALLLRQLFFDMQCIRIRKLSDPPASHPDRAVASIAAILDSVRKNLKLITRYNYVTNGGVPYDPFVAIDRKAELFSKSRHSWFDILCSTTETDRHPNQTPTRAFIKSANKHMNELAIFRRYANKYVAHAATEESRAQMVKDLPQLSLKQLETGYRSIIYAAKIMERLIGEYILAEVGTPQFDVLEDWDQPLVTEVNRDYLWKYWEDRRTFLDQFEKSGRI